MSPDGDAWFLLNASPEIRAQIESFPPLHPRGLRHSPVEGVLLTNGDLDHTLGLLSLRESHPLVLYATEEVRSGFVEKNRLYRTLERFPGQVTWRELPLGVEVELSRRDTSAASGLSAEAFAVPGKLPIHLEGSDLASCAGENVGLRIRERASDRVLAYVPAAGGFTAEMVAALQGADCVFLDGTFWSDDELRDRGVGDKRAGEMAHVPIGGEGGSLERLSGLRASRRIFIHVNNTNPVLREDSVERAAVERAGWRVAHDGMEIAL